MIKVIKGVTKKIQSLSRKKQKVEFDDPSRTRVYANLVYFRKIKNLSNIIFEVSFDDKYKDTENEYIDFENLRKICRAYMIRQKQTGSTLISFKSENDLSDMINIYCKNVEPWCNGNQFVSAIIQVMKYVPVLNEMVDSPDVDGYGEVPFIQIMGDLQGPVFVDNPDNFNCTNFNLDLLPNMDLLAKLSSSVYPMYYGECIEQTSTISLLDKLKNCTPAFQNIIDEMNANACQYVIRGKHLVNDIDDFIGFQLSEDN